MNNYVVVVLLALQIACALSSSFGRYKQGHRPVERQKRMHKSSSGDCMFSICEHVPNYPDSEVVNIIQKHSALHSYFGGSVIEPSVVLSFPTRMNEEPPTPLCKTKDASTIPREMTDIDGVKRSIANAGNYSQVLKYQICSYENGENCFPGNMLGYKTTCEQRYNVIKLITVNFGNEKLEYRKFSIPSTCVCTYVKIDN